MTHQLAKYLEKEMRRVGIDVLSPAETSMVSIQIQRDLCLSEEFNTRDYVTDDSTQLSFAFYLLTLCLFDSSS